MTQINQNLDFNFSKRKVLNEKRKRHQTYLKLNFLLSLNTCVDFFTLDAFNIFKNIIRLGQSCPSNEVKKEVLFQSFLEIAPKFTQIFEEGNIIEPQTLNTWKKNMRKSESLFSRLKKNLMYAYKAKAKVYNQFSYDFTEILEKTIENALYRFKSPIITSEILFITLLEQNEMRIPSQNESLVLNSSQWQALHYTVLKRIHNQESSIRNKVKKSDQYFAYILKTLLPEIQFDRLIEEDLLPFSTAFFRSKLLVEASKISLSRMLEQNIYNSIKISRRRKYSVK